MVERHCRRVARRLVQGLSRRICVDTRGLPAELALWREMPVILQHANKTQRNSGARPCPYRTCASRVFFLSDSHSRIVPVVKKGKRSEEVERKGRLTRDVAVVPPHPLHTALDTLCGVCARAAPAASAAAAAHTQTACSGCRLLCALSLRLSRSRTHTRGQSQYLSLIHI